MRQLARCKIPGSQPSSTVSINICQGSVLDFKHEKGAIVNAANEGCLGGGGVDAAISKAGASKLLQDRLGLPIVSTKQLKNGVQEIRCPTGNIFKTIVCEAVCKFLKEFDVSVMTK